MPTREELLRGVVKVNHERADSTITTARSQEEVHGNDSKGGDKLPGDNGTRSNTSEPVVQGAEGSLAEVLTRRQRLGRREVGELTSRIDSAIEARGLLKKELAAIEKVLEEL